MAAQKNFHQYRFQAKEGLKTATVMRQSEDDLRAQKDFPFFCEHITRNAPEPKKQPPHMQLWNEQILTGLDSKALLGIAGPNIDLLSPRGSAKSTYVAMLLAWLIGGHALHKKLLKILYISYTVDIARPKSAAIKAIIESKEYQQVFPCVRPGERWSDEYWQIDYTHAGIPTLGDEAFTLMCAGLRGGIVSKRSNLICFDDIIKSSKDIENPDVREEMVNNYLNAIKPTLFEGGRMICLGTRFRGDDIHTTTFIPDRGWVQIEQSALVEDEEGNERSYWEEMWSTAYLIGLRDGPDGDPIAFSFQYQNKVVSVSDIAILSEWIVRSEMLDDLRLYDSLALGIDLSSKQLERHDFTVFTLGGRIGDDFHILDMRRGKWMGNVSKLEEVLDMFCEWGILYCEGEKLSELEDERVFRSTGIPITIYGEDAQYQASLEGDFKTIMHDKHQLYELRYRPSSVANQDKLMRLRSVSGLFEARRVKFNMYRNLSFATTELINFGTGCRDDCPDSIAHCLRGLRALPRLEAA